MLELFLADYCLFSLNMSVYVYKYVYMYICVYMYVYDTLGILVTE